MTGISFVFAAFCFFVVGAQGCGIPNNPTNVVPKKTSYIVGGQEAKPHSWPWMAVMGTVSDTSSKNINLRCGASVVDVEGTWVIVTAAHCVDGLSNNQLRRYKIGLGYHNRFASEDSQEVYDIDSSLKHTSYSPQTLANDIAIIYLTRNITETKMEIQPICIANINEDNLVGNNCVVTGWGSTSSGGSVSSQLLQVFKPLLSPQQCGGSVPGFRSDTMLCAGNLTHGGSDSCQGDSGGPFACRIKGSDDVERYHLTGIVSWGYGCADAGSPGVYARASQYVQWLRNNKMKSFSRHSK